MENAQPHLLGNGVEDLCVQEETIHVEDDMCDLLLGLLIRRVSHGWPAAVAVCCSCPDSRRVREYVRRAARNEAATS
jgi:hypothetical protein